MPTRIRPSALIDQALLATLGLILATMSALLTGPPLRDRRAGDSPLPMAGVLSTRLAAGARANGACCLPDGSCLETDSSSCATAGGTFDANGDCSNVATCMFNDDCIVTTQDCCNAVGGTWGANSTCDPNTCIPSFNFAADAVWEGAPSLSNVAVSPAARGARSILAYIDSNQVLQIIGTPTAESIRLVLDPNDPSQLNVYSPEDGSGQFFPFALASFVSIAVQLGDGDDLIVFDDVNGEVGPLKPFNIDAGDGQDIILTRTGGLPLAQVLTLVNQIDTLRNLTQQADTIRQLAGAVPNFPAGSDTLSNAFSLLTDVEQDFITPASVYVQDLEVQLIEPATQAVVGAHDQIIAVGLPLIQQAYNDLALAGQALVNDADVNIKTPALNLLDIAQNQLLVDANDVAACGGQLSSSDVTAFQNTLVGLVNQIVAIVDSCPDEPNEPPEAAGVCPQVQELIDCIEKEIEDFEQVADICESDGDNLEAEGDSLEASGDGLEQYADGYEQNLEDFEGLADPNFVGVAEGFEAAAEALVAGWEASLGATGNTFDQRAQTEFVQMGDAYMAAMDMAVRAKADQIQQQADQIELDAEAIIQAASVLLGGGAAPGPRASACANISTTNTISGGPGPNILLGTSGNDLIHGFGGSDLIIGGPGDDKLYGDDGADLILGNGGTNEIHGGDGIDILIGGGQVDCIYGEDGIDLILGRKGNDELDGGANVDVIIAGDGDDSAWGRDGIDILVGGDGIDMLDGGHCSDLLIGGAGDDTLIGGPGQVVSLSGVSLDLGDLLFGGDGADTIYGDQLSKDGTGVDVAFGGDGADKIYLADGCDLVINNFTLKLGNVAFGGAGNDTIESKKGIDVLFGGDDDDTISADEGYNVTFPNSNFQMAFGDFLFGGPGNDTLEGDDADPNAVHDIDFLFGYTGDDTLNAYDGGLIVFSSSFQMDFGNLLFGGEGNDTLTSGKGIDLAFGGPDDDVIRCGTGSTIIYDTSLYIEFGDLMFGQGGNDVMNANDPNQPSSNAADGIDLMFGGPGDDELYGDGGGLVTIGTSAGFTFGNLMFGESGADIIKGGYQNPDPNNPPDGIDLIFGAGDDDTIDGGIGSYIVVIAGSGAFAVDFGDLIFGGPDNDTIDSGKGMDFVFCGRGDDTANTRTGISPSVNGRECFLGNRTHTGRTDLWVSG